MLAPYLVGKKFYESLDQPSMPWMPRAHRSHQLESAVVENWTDETHAFRDFIATRGERRFTAAVVTSGLSFAAQASRVTWVKYTFKGMVRFIPIIGWGMLAYDLYNLGEDLDLY